MLDTLAPDEYRRLAPHLKLVHLRPGQILYDAGEHVRVVYFPTGGMVSLLSTTGEGETIELALVGKEGMIGVPAVLSPPEMPYGAIDQIKGDAIVLGSDLLRLEFNRGGRLQKLILRYIQTLLRHVSQSAICNHYHTVEERLCRWLLIVRDRVGSNQFDLTHEAISRMLGAPRSSVTAAAGNLRRKGLIRLARGKITIVDHRSLRAVSCECYGIFKGEIDHLNAA